MQEHRASDLARVIQQEREQQGDEFEARQKARNQAANQLHHLQVSSFGMLLEHKYKFGDVFVGRVGGVGTCRSEGAPVARWVSNLTYGRFIKTAIHFDQL